MGGTRFVYRELGIDSGVPVIFLNHLAANLDNWDPRVVDGIAAKHRVITFDNRGVGGSEGKTPETVEAMAHDAVAFIRALGFDRVDLLGFSLGGMVSQVIAQQEPTLVRKIILAGTGPAGGEGIVNVTKLTYLDTFHAYATFKDPKELLFFTRTNHGKSEARAFIKRLKERTNDRDKAMAIGAFRTQLKAIHAWGLEKPADLSRIQQPVLVANGDADRMVPSSNSYDLARAPPECHAADLPRRWTRRHLPGPRTVRSRGARIPGSDDFMTSLADQTVLVTGANRGMGREYVAQLLDRGVTKVYAAARDPRTIDVADPRVVPLQLDVTDATSVAEAAAVASDVSVLINNAGIYRASLGPRSGHVQPARGDGDEPVRSAGDGIRVRRSDSREVRRHCQRRVGARVDARRRELRGDEGRDVERHRLDALELGSRGVQVVGVYVGLVDTDMAKFADYPKSDPADVVRQVLDGIESGADEVLADEMTREVRAHLSKPIHERSRA